MCRFISCFADLVADGHAVVLFHRRTDNDRVVAKAAVTYELLAINPQGQASHSTPAVASERMYLSTYSHLFSIGGKKVNSAKVLPE